MGRYDDILHHPRPVSRRHPQMPNSQRAKQFMPFAALRGYGEAISEREVRYEGRAILSDEDRAIVDATLRKLAGALARGEHPRVTLEYFEPRRDGDGERGLCRAWSGPLEKLIPELRMIRAGGRTFSFGDITDIWREEG